MTFTNMVYSEFDSTPANVLADIRTVLTSCASVSRPNSGSEPDAYKITTTDGADMVFDLNDSAVTSTMLTIGAFKNYDGTTFTDKLVRYLNWRPSGGATTNPIHCVVSVSKEHVFIGIEGPRAPETGAVSTLYGSYRSYFAMSAVTKYHAGDVATAVCVGQNHTGGTTSTVVNGSHKSHITRNYGNTQSWEPGLLQTLAFPMAGATQAGLNVVRTAIGDGNFYLSPYVFFGDAGGIRGRLKAFHHAGFTVPDVFEAGSSPVGSTVTYDGQLYKLIGVNKSETNTIQVIQWSGFGGSVNNNGTLSWASPVVAIPCT